MNEDLKPKLSTAKLPILRHQIRPASLSAGSEVMSAA